MSKINGNCQIATNEIALLIIKPIFFNSITRASGFLYSIDNIIAASIAKLICVIAKYFEAKIYAFSSTASLHSVFVSSNSFLSSDTSF